MTGTVHFYESIESPKHSISASAHFCTGTAGGLWQPEFPASAAELSHVVSARFRLCFHLACATQDGLTCCVQGLAMLATLSSFNWGAEAKRAAILLDQHDGVAQWEEELHLDELHDHQHRQSAMQ